MRFIIGLLVGLGLGFVAAILLAPERNRRKAEGPPEEEAVAGEWLGENHDTWAGLRRAMRDLQAQVQEAWEEARQAAEEAEAKMRARYERTVSKPRR